MNVNVIIGIQRDESAITADNGNIVSKVWSPNYSLLYTTSNFDCMYSLPD